MRVFFYGAVSIGEDEARSPRLTTAESDYLTIPGDHPKIVSEHLGHSNIAITMDTYSHVMPGLQEEAVLTLDAQININSASGMK